MDPSYSLNLSPSDYYLFLAMVNDCVGEKFASKEASENRLFSVANRDANKLLNKMVYIYYANL